MLTTSQDFSHAENFARRNRAVQYDVQSIRRKVSTTGIDNIQLATTLEQVEAMKVSWKVSREFAPCTAKIGPRLDDEMPACSNTIYDIEKAHKYHGGRRPNPLARQIMRDLRAEEIAD